MPTAPLLPPTPHPCPPPLGAQATSCVERLASLQTALGGELCAIIRARDPGHALLKLERPPIELDEQGVRPRIVTEANRLAQLERLQRQLSAARRGVSIRGRGDGVDEAFAGMVAHRQEMMETLREAGGPSSVVTTGKLGAFYDPEQRQAGRAPGLPPGTRGQQGSGGSRGSSSSSVSVPLGLVITDEPPAEAQQAATAASSSSSARGADHPAAEEAGSSASMGGAQRQAGSGDILALILGGMPEGGQAGEEADAERESRRERHRKRWWIGRSTSSFVEDS